MTYKILIKDSKGSYNYATMQKPVTEKRTVEGVEVELPTGGFVTVPYETTSIDELKTKYRSLMNTMSHSSIKAVVDMTETITVDLSTGE